MRVYLAARYGRRLELCGYREVLRARGYDVQARWLDGGHQISNDGTPIGDAGNQLVEGDSGAESERAAALRARFAAEDWRDVANADIVISFTEPPRSSASRGGRHVEFGIALGRGIPVIVVGYRENLFHWMPNVDFFPKWEDCLNELTSRLSGAFSPNWFCVRCGKEFIDGAPGYEFNGYRLCWDCPLEMVEEQAKRWHPHIIPLQIHRILAQLKTRKRKASSRKLFREILARYKFTCAKCGTGRDLTLDHIKPVSLGGDDRTSNLQILCRSCNSKKGTRMGISGPGGRI